MLLLHYDWPPPQSDRDSISVDRIRDDIDGPSHRFLIKRGDTVEVFFSRDKQEIGEVVGISHAERQVRVQFCEGTKGIWFDAGRIYPVVEQETQAKADRLSAPIEPTNHEPEDRFEKADRVDYEPYSLEAFREYRKRYETGTTSLGDHRCEFARVQARKDAFLESLTSGYDAQRLKILAARFGCFRAKQNNKQQNAEHVYRAIVQSFALGNSIQYNPMSETLEQAVAREVAAITDEQWEQHLTERAEQQQLQEKASSNPETLAEFRIAVRDRGVESLSDEQRVRFDELLADESRATRSDG